MQNWVMPNLSAIFNCRQGVAGEELASPAAKGNGAGQVADAAASARAKLKAQREWRGAIAALECLLSGLTDTAPADSNRRQGVLLSAPAPVLSRAELAARFHLGIFSPEAQQNPQLLPSFLPTAAPCQQKIADTPALPLLSGDPLASEQFCLALTPWFSLLLVLGEDSRGLPAFHFSFEPEAVALAWRVLRSRLSSLNYAQFAQINDLVAYFPSVTPDYRLVMQFSRLMLQHLPELPTVEVLQPRTGGSPPCSANQLLSVKPPAEVELLRALTHEIRTPLTTIRTMARLLLRHPNLTPAMAQQLQAIDRECTAQIDRMELIFRAIELETAASQEQSVQLVPMSLAQVLQASIPRWKKQAERRNVELDVVLPQELPQVVSDPVMFDRVLAGLMEKFTGSLPMGGKICLEVTTAGNQIKLQFHTQSACPTNPFKSLGHLLVFQPETGSLSLNLNVTKNLFQALGGKLIVRQRSQQEEIFTIFFPLERRFNNAKITG